MIGIFDSGSGGLTVLRAIRDVLPSADSLYFGDIKNVPYGNKSREELSALTIDAITLLHVRGARSIVSACNSVSASLAISLFDTLSIAPDRLIEMIGPTVTSFRGSNERLLLCATTATIMSGMYQNGFHMIGKDIGCVAIAPLAAAIENGAPAQEIESIIETNLARFPLDSFDTLILGCTHYPLVTESFRNVLGNSLRLFDPAIAVAARAKEQLAAHEEGTGAMQFVISKDSPQFRSLVEKLFSESSYSIEVLE